MKGRKRHLLVDVEGFPLKLVVHSAGMQDRDGAALVLDGLRRRFPKLELIWADAAYDARQVAEAVARRSCAQARNRAPAPEGQKGFMVQPRRWVVERTFAWLGRNRRLAKDFENLVETATAFLALAAIQLLLRRLARAATF